MPLRMSDLHNFGMNMLNDLIGWTDVYLLLSNPEREIPIMALVSKNESAYKRSNTVYTKDYKLFKIFVDDITELNTTYSINIPVPPHQLKSNNISVRVDNGNPYQIKAESTGSFDGKKIMILELERDT